MIQKATVTFFKNDFGFAKTEDLQSIFFHLNNERDVKFLDNGEPFLSIFRKQKQFSKVQKGTSILVDIVRGNKGLKAEAWGIAPTESTTKQVVGEQEPAPLYRVLKHTRFVGSSKECTPDIVWKGNDLRKYPRNYRLDYFSCGDFDNWISFEKMENDQWVKTDDIRS